MIHPHDSAIVLTLGRIVVPIAQLFGFYVLIFGQHGPGGGFVGGVVLAASMILAILIFGIDAENSRLAKIVLHGDGLGLLIFAFVSIALLVVLRKWIKGKFYGHVGDVQDLSKNIDEFTGQSVVVLQDVIPNKMDGAVEFKGARWRAVSDENIKNGEMAIISGVDGIILKVRKKQEG